MLDRETKKYDYIIKAFAICLLLLAWLLYSRANPRVFPTPLATWQRFVKLLHKPIMSVSIWGHIGISLRRVLLALLASIVLGIPSASCAAGYRESRRRSIRSSSRCAPSRPSPGSR